MTNDLTYNQAFAALEVLVNRLEEGEIELEELPATIQQANALISICEMKLRATGDAVEAATRQETGNKQ